jgi:uncharacterized protein (TIGR03437 family)
MKTKAILSTLLGLASSFGAAQPAGAMEPGDAGVPTIAQVQNNYSWILPGAPNYGIAPGSIFVILGSGMATPGAQAILQDSSQKGGLPLTLNGASVTVVVSGVSEHPALYYATPTAIAAVLPSTTPLGTGTFTVTYNNVTSQPVTAPVVQSALGLASMSGDGAGQVMATDANYHFFSPTAPAVASQIITLWGTGLGADVRTSDLAYSPPNQITNIPLATSVGGTPATVIWAGRSGYPGLDQINIQLPAPSQSYTGNYVPVPDGCAVLLAATSGSAYVASNNLSLPFTVSGGACTHPPFVVDPGVAQQFGGMTTVNFASLAVLQYGSQLMAGGSFDVLPGAALTAYAGSGAAGGSCIVVPPLGTYQALGAFAGSLIGLSGPAGQQLYAYNSGDYGGPLPASWTAAAGETFSFMDGLGPVQTTGLGAFNTSVSFPAPLEWTNQSSIGTISRPQGVELTWTGGDANGVVAIRGTAFGPSGSQPTSTSFMCSAPASLGQFTVPSSVLQALPVGPGTLPLENQSAPQNISASGLNAGYLYAGATYTINAAYN